MTPTIQYKDIYGELIEADIQKFWDELIYKPIKTVLKKYSPVKLNTQDSPEGYLLKKLQSGNMIYDGKFFYGKFDAKASKMLRMLGATWDQNKKAFRLLPGSLTPDMKVAISISESRLKNMNMDLLLAIDNAYNNMQNELSKLSLDKDLDHIISALDNQAQTAVKSLSVSYTLTKDMRDKLKDDYTNNLSLYIKEWTDMHIIKLRKEVQKNAMTGYRHDQLIEAIQHRYGTSQTKAKFLARQETSLFMSKFRRERFLDAGLGYYRWSTSKDQRVRSDHKRLDGKIFMFGDPPIVDLSTGRRAEPGEDFQCRCRAIPITNRHQIRKVNGEYVIISK